MINAKEILRQYNQAKTSGQDTTTFSFGSVTPIGVADLFVVPFDEPSTVIRINKPGIKSKRIAPPDEYKLIRSLAAIKSKSFTLPQPVAYGEDPDWVQTKHEGIPFEWSVVYARPEMEELGRAVGEFCGRIKVQFGVVHPALYPHVLSRTSDGKFEIGQLATLRKADHIEESFLAPLRNLCFGIFPAMATEIEKVTGMAINREVLLDLVKTKLDDDLKIPEGVAELRCVNSNLRPWLGIAYNARTRSFDPA